MWDMLLHKTDKCSKERKFGRELAKRNNSCRCVQTDAFIHIQWKQILPDIEYCASQICQGISYHESRRIQKNRYGFLEWIGRQCCDRVKRSHSDNAGEFLSMKKTLIRKRIDFTTSIPYTLESNGIAKRINRSLMDKVRAMLEEASMEKRFWRKAVLHGSYLMNRTATPLVEMWAPHTALFECSPENSKLWTFWCKSYARTLKARSHRSGVIARKK